MREGNKSAVKLEQQVITIDGGMMISHCELWCLKVAVNCRVVEAVTWEAEMELGEGEERLEIPIIYQTVSNFPGVRLWCTVNSITYKTTWPAAF